MWPLFVLSMLTVLDGGAAKTASSLDPATYSPSRTVIVLSQNTQVFAADKPIGVIPPGSVLHFSKVSEKWLMVPRFGGWVFADDVVPIENAVKHFTSIVEKQPSASAFLHRGIAHLQLDELDEAKADFEEAIRRGTKDGAVYINLANVLQQRGLTQEALANYSKGIELSPDLALSYIERSSILMEMKQFPEAAADLEKAISLEPTSPDAYNNRGVLHQLQGRNEDSVKDFTKAIELFSKDSSAYANRGFVLQQLGRYGEALADFETALVIDPNSDEIANDAAWLLATCPDAKIRNPARAIELANRVCTATHRENGLHLDTLATALAAAQKYDEAVKVSEEALELLKTDNQAIEVHARLELFRQKKPFVETLVKK